MPPPTPTRRPEPRRSKNLARPRRSNGSANRQRTGYVPPDRVYEFARQMENLPRSASGLAAGIKQENGEWFGESPMGLLKVEMAAGNDFRVSDHDVTLPDGTTMHNAFRVKPAVDRSLLAFVVLPLPGVPPKLSRTTGARGYRVGCIEQAVGRRVSHIDFSGSKPARNATLFIRSTLLRHGGPSAQGPGLMSTLEYTPPTRRDPLP